MRPLENDLYPVLREAALSIMVNPTDDTEWTIQGFGMMRCYLDAERTWRLNIWHKSLQVPGVSIVHDHPWHFDSWVLGGLFHNTRFVECDDAAEKPTFFHGAERFKWKLLETGIQSPVPEMGGKLADHDGIMWLNARDVETYQVGSYYNQRAPEVHMTTYADAGAVTINRRVKTGHPDHARVFWPEADDWVSAKPRKATRPEVDRYCDLAIDLICKR